MRLRDATWVLTTGMAGMRSQALGLAEAVGLPVEEKRVSVGAPWSWPPGGLLPMPLAALGAASDKLEPPWPRLVVACGRQSIGPALAVKRLSGGATLAAYVQNPEWGLKKFDLVAAMPHDGVRGRNVVISPTALHNVTREKLLLARSLWRSRLTRPGNPTLGVLLGGDNGGYRLTEDVTHKLVRVLTRAHAEHGFHAAVTPSRRTPDVAKRLIADPVGSEGLGWMWDETGDNPYMGILASADRLIVTAESISMISEALTTGRPVHVLPLEGGGKRHEEFLTRIVDERLVSRIVGVDLDWSFEGPGPIDSTAAPAARLLAMLDRRPM